MTPSILVVLFFITILIIGFKANKKNTIPEFLYSGRKVTAPALIATLVTTWYGGINEIGIEVINNGLVTWLYFGLFYYIAAFLYAYIIAPKIINKNYRSIPTTIYRTYGRIPGIISLSILLLYLMPASYILILGQLISEIFSINQTTAIIIGLIFSSIYTLKGGFGSILRTDKIQFIFMFFGFVILFGFLIFSDNYGLQLINNLYNRELNLFKIPGNAQWSYIIMFAFLSLLTFLDPSFHQRTFSGKNLKTVQKSILVSIFFWFIFDLMTISSALFYIEITLENGLNPNNTSSPYIALAKTVFENYPILMGVFFISILSVVMSTIDSYTFLSAITLKYDLNTILKKETNIKGIQQSTIFILIISFFLSSVFDRALYYWYYFGSYLLVSSFFPLIYALFDIKIKNVTLMMISSITITFIWDMLIINDFTQIPSIYIGLLAGFTIINLTRK
tara:strand:+ start:1426 stop:2772 length:1347 start_codon:yes stop_codon:yes gene_type:complete